MKGISVILVLGIFANIEATVYFCLDRKTYNNHFSASNIELETLKDELKEILINDDTIHFDNVNFDFDHPALAATGNFEDLDIANLTNFNIDLLNFNNISSIELANITFSNISFSGKYDLFGTVGQLFEIYGKGSFWANLIRFSVSITTGIELNSTELCIPVTIDANVQKVENYFENFMDGDDLLCPLMNRAISSLGQEAVGIIWSEIKNKVDSDLQKIIDNILHRGGTREAFTKLIIMANENHDGIM